MGSHMPINNLRRCSNISYMYDMDMGCSLKGYAASTKSKWHGLHTCIRLDFSQLSQSLGSICGDNDVNHMPIHNLRRCSNTSYMYDMDMGCSLKGSTA
jgi:hypothetical protein